MTDQTESASEYAELLVQLDEEAKYSVLSMYAAAAIRALEAQAAAAEAAVQDLEYRLDADGVREMQDELTYQRAKAERLSKAWEAADRNLQWMSPDLFQLRRDHEGLRAALAKERATTLDLAMLVRKMARELRSVDYARAGLLRVQALAYLKRKGLQGSVLRDDPAALLSGRGEGEGNG